LKNNASEIHPGVKQITNESASMMTPWCY